MIGKRRIGRLGWQVAVAISLAAALTACAGRVMGVLQPVTPAAGASTVDMLVATTRAPTTIPGELFSGERGSKLSLTEITVSVPPDGVHKIGQVEWPSRVPPNPQREFAALKVTPLTVPGSGRAWVKAHLSGNRRILIFVHGFNNRFDDAVFRFAQIVHDSRADVVPILFTWPSSASIFGYNYDRESTNYSRDALEEMLQTAAKDPTVGEVTVLAHSMGTWLVMESLRQMAIRDGRVAPKIRNVVLASPDIDVDVFARQWSEFGKDRPKLTVFVSQDDRALSLSRRIAGNVDRLGQINPNIEPYRSEFEKSGISIIDLTALTTSGDRLNHDKFAASPEVVRAIGTRLVAGQTITDSEVGIGDRIGSVVTTAAQTVGAGAALAISAPIAIVDPVTRRNYSERVDQFGNSVSNTVGSVGDTVGSTVEGVSEPLKKMSE